MNKLKKNQPVNKSCPKCGVSTKLVVKQNSKNGSWFLGCPNWPECKHTENIPTDIMLQLLGQLRLL